MLKLGTGKGKLISYNQATPLNKRKDDKMFTFILAVLGTVFFASIFHLQAFNISSFDVALISLDVGKFVNYGDLVLILVIFVVCFIALAIFTGGS